MNRIQRRLRELRGDERGTTLLEMVVGMTLLASFLGMFTTATVLMSNSITKVDAINSSSGQVNAVFLRLDKAVRYASGLSAPAKSSTSGDWHVEFDTTTAGADVCTQLRVDGTSFQQRTWSVTRSGYSTVSTWATLASNITNGTQPATSTTTPFSLPDAAATASSRYRQLTITVVASSGTSSMSPTQNTFTFTAINSSVASTAPVCQQLPVDQLS